MNIISALTPTRKKPDTTVCRVVIENVQPEIDGGKYPIKRVQGERVDVSADIFADGHDTIRAALAYRKVGDRNWQHTFMEAHPNDAWTASFTPTEKGYYEYQIEAWIDHLYYWYESFKKKYNAGQQLQLELREGIELLERTAALQPKKQRSALQAQVENLSNDNYEAAVQSVLTPTFEQVVHDHPLKRNVSTYDRGLRVYVERKKALFSTWYEFFPRSASPDRSRWGTFKDAEALLPRVAEMGFDVLYLPPVHPIGEVNRKGRNNSTTAQPGEPGSPWAIGSQHGGHKAVSPELGTMEDYEHLIKTAREEYGIEVALDLAYQAAPDHPWVKDRPEWFVERPDGSIMYAENPPKKYQDIHPINFETEAWKSLYDELLSVIVFWVEKGVHVFRVDNPHTKPMPFWEWAIAEVKKEHPDVIFLSEAFTRPKRMASLAKVGFTQGYTYFTWRNNREELTEYLTELTQTEWREFFRPNFWPNTPDILPYELQNAGENHFMLRVALAATLSSNYGLYGPAYELHDNQGFNGKEEYLYSEKYEAKHYDWDARNRTTDLITKLNRVRKEQPALQTTWHIHFGEADNEQLFSYLKTDQDGQHPVWAIINMDSRYKQSGYVKVPREALGISEGEQLRVRDLLTGETYHWGEEWNYVELHPDRLPLHLFEVEVLRGSEGHLT